MKLAIYDTVHLDWIIPLAELLYNSSYRISFFVHSSMKEDIISTLALDVYEKYEWSYLNDEPIDSRYRFLDKKIKQHNYTIFWLNTADSKHLAFALLKIRYPKMKLLVNVHDVNDFFNSSLSIDIKRSLRHISKRLLAKNIDAYLLNAERMKDYIISNHLTRKTCYSIAPVYYKPVKSNNTGKFIVVIPGTIDEKRRDYQTALEAWKIFIHKKPDTIKANLILAGGVNEYGKNILDHCQTDDVLKETVTIYTNPIPELTFQELISSASLLISPQVIKSTTRDGITEVYGITKNSGNSYDAIRYAKPFVVPTALNIPKELETYTKRYTSADDLADILINLYTNEKEYNRLYQKAQKTSEVFSYSIMQKKIENMITEVLSHNYYFI